MCLRKCFQQQVLYFRRVLKWETCFFMFAFESCQTKKNNRWKSFWFILAYQVIVLRFTGLVCSAKVRLENHIKLWKLRVEKLSFCYLNRNHVGTKRSKNEIKLYLSPRSNSCFSVSGSLIFLKKVQVESYILRKRVSIETKIFWCSIKNLSVQDVQSMRRFLNCLKLQTHVFL